MFNRHVSHLRPVPNPLQIRQDVGAAARARAVRLPAQPRDLDALFAQLARGLPHAARDSAAAATLRELRGLIWSAPGRESESEALWREALATAGFAARLAEVRRADAATAAAGGLLHRVGDALALQSLAAAEAEQGARLDGPSQAQLCAGLGRELAESLVREWPLSGGIATCVLGWRLFGEFAAVSPEASAVYFGRFLALELLHPGMSVPGALDAAAGELGLTPEAIEWVRGEAPAIRAAIATLG